MQNKTVQICLYILHSLLFAGIYGVFGFYVIYRGLAGGVMLNAYFWNIAFIVGFLVLDKVVNDILLDKEYIITKENYLITMVVHSLSLISFRTILYLFYTFILIASRVSILEPELLNDEFRSFVFSIEYCLILLVAFDKFIEQLLRDDRRIRRISTKFMAFVTRKRVKKSGKGRKP